MNLFYVESPFQLLCAFEASKFFGNGRYVIRLSGVERNDIQLQNLVKLLKIENFEFIFVPIQTLNLNSLIAIIKNRLKSHNKIFIGNYESKFMKIVLLLYNKNRICLLDDGAKTIFIQNKLFNNKKNYNMFTIFNKLKAYHNQKIYINSFQNLKTILKQNNLQQNEKYILFIGSKLVELNMIQKEEYLNYLLKIYHNFKLPILYIAHRGEDLSKFKKLKNIDFKITYLDYPLELYGLYNSIPQKIVSFYSTALFSLKFLYNSEFYYIKYNFENDIVKSVYDYLKTTDIKEVKL